jgi:hypothetical protein
VGVNSTLPYFANLSNISANTNSAELTTLKSDNVPFYIQGIMPYTDNVPHQDGLKGTSIYPEIA